MARFWDWRPQAVTNTDGSTALAEPILTLEPVELYTKTAMLFGLVAAEGRRLSDILNANSVLSLRDARSTSLFASVDGSQGQGWTGINREEILFVMPPEHESPRQLRIHRRQHRVRIQTGPFQITGNAHVLPGTALDAYALQTRMHFLAVTNAQVYGMVDSAFERAAPVVLVNVRPIEDLTEVLTLS